MDFTHGTGRHAGRRYHWCLPCGILFGLMAFVTMLTFGVLSYIDHGGIAHCVEGDWRATRKVPKPGYPESLEPDDQVAIASGKVPEELVVQEGQLHVRSDDPARRYAEQEQVAEHDTDADEASGAEDRRRQIRLPKLPIPSEILDIPIKIPTRVSEILGDLPIPTIPTDPGDIIDSLPTDPGELISDLPIPTLPSIPAIPTLPVPVPIPTKIPDLPIPTGTNLPGVPLPTVQPPSKPKDPYKLPDLTEIPHRVLTLLHGSISKLSTSKDTPKYLRDVLRLILRILNRVAGGKPVPDPWPSKTLPLPTKTKLPLPTLTVPTVPRFPPLPRPTLTLPTGPKRPGRPDSIERAAEEARDEGGGGEELLSDERRKQLRASVADEVWAGADWSNPLLAPLTAAAAMLTFDAVYAVAGKWKETDDEGEKDRLLGLFVVVNDDE
ncbi:hypothetical protein INS49_010963 [Diaporthe citri]|uniref:uncharacterized protein n=1 Tax=Diaporthe citri TaxID=83186 RepID=UPI001C7FA76B|nr:uncharacterized protein INS49_010963 [Diaporthe citri]KAG6359910.1 hypothetical protein INS49_010963 [Diaporthe citri]